MANWMKCEYYDASLDRSKPNNGLPINDEPVNLDMCETIKRDEVPRVGKYFIRFIFQKNEPVGWEFINAELRDKEYNRALKLIGLIENSSNWA